MRRVLFIVIGLVILGGIGYGGFRYGFQQGTTAGQATAASDRTAFEASRGSAAAGGQGGAGAGAGQGGAGGRGAAGGSPGAAGSTGASAPAGGAARGPAMSGSPATGGSPAANRPPGMNGVSGRVTMVSGSTFTVQSGSDNASVNVTTAGDTIFTTLVAGSTGDLKLNDFVTVQGMMMGANAFTATTITGTSAQQLAAVSNAGVIGGPGMMGGMAARGSGAPMDGASLAGRITQLGVNMITVATADGTVVTVNTTPTTRVRTTKSASASDIQAGDNVIVIGDRTGESVTARLVTDQGQG